MKSLDEIRAEIDRLAELIDAGKALLPTFGFLGSCVLGSGAGNNTRFLSTLVSFS